MMNQKTAVMLVSGIVAGVTSLVFTGSAMGLLGIKKKNVELDTSVVGAGVNQPTPPKKKAKTQATNEEESEKSEIETEL